MMGRSLPTERDWTAEKRAKSRNAHGVLVIENQTRNAGGRGSEGFVAEAMGQGREGDLTTSLVWIVGSTAPVRGAYDDANADEDRGRVLDNGVRTNCVHHQR